MGPVVLIPEIIEAWVIVRRAITVAYRGWRIYRRAQSAVDMVDEAKERLTEQYETTNFTNVVIEGEEIFPILVVWDALIEVQPELADPATINVVTAQMLDITHGARYTRVPNDPTNKFFVFLDSLVPYLLDNGLLLKEKWDFDYTRNDTRGVLTEIIKHPSLGDIINAYSALAHSDSKYGPEDLPKSFGSAIFLESIKKGLEGRTFSDLGTSSLHGVISSLIIKYGTTIEPTFIKAGNGSTKQHKLQVINVGVVKTANNALTARPAVKFITRALIRQDVIDYENATQGAPEVAKWKKITLASQLDFEIKPK